MDEGRKRVVAIVAGILVARHIKTADELFDAKATPRTESMIAAAVQWGEADRQDWPVRCAQVKFTSSKKSGPEPCGPGTANVFLV